MKIVSKNAEQKSKCFSPTSASDYKECKDSFGVQILEFHQIINNYDELSVIVSFEGLGVLLKGQNKFFDGKILQEILLAKITQVGNSQSVQFTTRYEVQPSSDSFKVYFDLTKEVEGDVVLKLEPKHFNFFPLVDLISSFSRTI